MVVPDFSDYKRAIRGKKSSFNDVDQEQDSTVKINAMDVTHTTLLMNLMNEISGNFARCLQNTTCNSWDLETNIHSYVSNY